MKVELGCECRRLTNVMATVLALEAGGFLIVTLPIERKMARTISTICTAWTSVFRCSSNRLSILIMDVVCRLSFVDQSVGIGSLETLRQLDFRVSTTGANRACMKG